MARDASARWTASMRVRIVAVVVILLLLSSIGSVLLLRIVLFDRLGDEISVSLDREAEEFQLLAAGTDPRSGQPFGNDVEAIFDVYFSREVADEGETLLAFVNGELYASSRATQVPDPEEFSATFDEWLAFEETTKGAVDTDGGRAQYVAVPLGDADQDALFVVANFPANERDEITDALQTQVLVQLGTTVVASLLGLALAGRVLRPLKDLATTARTISETDLSRRIPAAGKDEASQIALAFNDMLGRLEQSFVTQRQFLDDTSHELRTPLTIIRGSLELLELDETPEERRRTVHMIIDETDRMDRIVSDLFLLARAERTDFLVPEPLELADFVLTVHRKMQALAGRDWTYLEPPPAWVLGDRDRLTQAMLQLAHNAVKFTNDGDAVEVGARIDDGWVQLWVSNTGPAVPEEDRTRIFTRFARGSAEARGQQAGAGLGLSIVSAIAAAHQGEARLIDREGWGASFEIRFPLVRPDVAALAGA